MKTYEPPDRLPRFGSLRTILDLTGTGNDVPCVGCAEGQLARHDKRRNHFWGLDSNAASLGVARPYYENLACVNLNQYAGQRLFGNMRFDIVVFADVLEHLLHPKYLLERLRSLLKPGGDVIVSLPNIGLWRVRYNLLCGKFDCAKHGVLDDTHLHFYTFASARRFVERCGYRMQQVLDAANELRPIARVGGNPLQRHLSGWPARELQERGYTVHGILAAKPLRGERLKVRPLPLGAVASKLTEPFVWRRPDWAFGLLAYKNLS